MNQLKVAKKESVKPQVDEKLSNSGSLEARERITRPNAFGPSAGTELLMIRHGNMFFANANT